MDRTEVEAVRSRTDIVELISGYTALKRAGSKWKGLCPFHQEKTPSFNVDPETGRWHCFGACGVGGDCFKFLERAENLTFGEALQKLAARAGIQLAARGATPAEREASARAQSEKDRIFAATGIAARFFRECFRRDRLAQEYARQRGLVHETLENFQIGYAPDDWSQLADFLYREKVHAEDAEKAGLIMASRRGDGSYTDRFRGRLMFPIVDVQERVVGFGGRLIVDKPDAPKYLNSPETPVFSKSRILYGLNRARKALAGARSGHEGESRILVVEGYMDVVAAHQAGIENVVATLGTAMTEEHVRLIRRYGVTNVVLSFDADEAGVKAALRAAELLAGAGEDLSLRVLSLPQGEDPDSLLRKGEAARFRRAIDSALTVPEFRLKGLEARADLHSDAGRIALLREAVAVIASVPSLLEQDVLIRRMSAYHPSYATNSLRAEESLRAEVQRAGGGRQNADDGFGQVPPPERRGGPTGYRRDYQNGANGNGGGGPRRWDGNGGKGGGGRYGPQPRFVAPDPVPMPRDLQSAAEKAEQTILRALLSDEWSPVLIRCLDGERLPALIQPGATQLAAALWPLVSGNLAPSTAVRELADVELADYASALRMEDVSDPLSEAVIEDALYRLGKYQYQRKQKQISTPFRPEEGGDAAPSDEELRQWSERARTLKRGGSGSDEDGEDG
jgi:DNA primase